MSGLEVPDHVPDWVVTAVQFPTTTPELVPDGEARLLLHLEALVALLVRAGAGRQTLDVLSGLFMGVRDPGPETGGTRL